MRWIVLWQAKKRAAWREARLKSLEQDAMQAEMVIKRMSEFNQAADTSSGSLSSTLRNATNPSASSDDNGNNNQPIPDYTNNNDEVRLIIRALSSIEIYICFSIRWPTTFRNASKKRKKWKVVTVPIRLAMAARVMWLRRRITAVGRREARKLKTGRLATAAKKKKISQTYVLWWIFWFHFSRAFLPPSF